MHDIIGNPQNYYVLQFDVDPNTNKVIPLRAAPFITRQSTRLSHLPPFATPKASRYGFRKCKGAVYLGIVYSPDDDTADMLFKVKIDKLNNKKAVAPFNNGTDLFVNMRATETNIKIFISSTPTIIKAAADDPKLKKFNNIDFD